MMMLSNANKVLAKILFWGETLRQRKQLSKMDDYLLKDIGVSRVEAAREANRKFWDHSLVVDESLQRRTDATLPYHLRRKAQLSIFYSIKTRNKLLKSFSVSMVVTTE